MLSWCLFIYLFLPIFISVFVCLFVCFLLLLCFCGSCALLAGFRCRILFKGVDSKSRTLTLWKWEEEKEGVAWTGYLNLNLSISSAGRHYPLGYVGLPDIRRHWVKLCKWARQSKCWWHQWRRLVKTERTDGESVCCLETVDPAQANEPKKWVTFPPDNLRQSQCRCKGVNRRSHGWSALCFVFVYV